MASEKLKKRKTLFRSEGKKNLEKFERFLENKLSQCQMKKINLKSHLKVTTTGFTTDCKTDF